MIQDGIHFGLPEADYHADDALGGGDLKRLLINPVGWWSNSDAGQRVLIDLGLAVEKEADADESLSKMFGSACHVMTLEPERFDSVYVEKEDMPVDYLATKGQIGEELQAIKAYVPPPSAGREEFIMAAKRAGLKVSDDWKVDELIRAEGRSILSKRWMAQLRMIDHLMRRPHPGIEGQRSIRDDTLANGYPEVSIFWTDERGVRLKARVDYLRLAGMVDLKTYGCPEDRVPLSFFLNQVAQYGYDFQIAAYREAWRQIARLIDEDRVFGVVDSEWVVKLRKSWQRLSEKNLTPMWRWLAVQTLRMPEIDWMDWSAGLAEGAAEAQRRQALNSFIEYRDRFGMDTPWVSLRGRTVVDDLTLDAAGVARRMMSRGEQVWTVPE